MDCGFSTVLRLSASQTGAQVQIEASFFRLAVSENPGPGLQIDGILVSRSRWHSLVIWDSFFASVSKT